MNRKDQLLKLATIIFEMFGTCTKASEVVDIVKVLARLQVELLQNIAPVEPTQKPETHTPKPEKHTIN